MTHDCVGRQTGHSIGATLARLLTIAISLALLCGCAAGTGPGATLGSGATPDPAQLLTGLAGQGEVEVPDDPLIIRSRRVRVNLGMLDSARAGETVQAHLFEDATCDIVLERKESTPSGGTAWSGHVAGVEGSQVTLIVGGGQMACNIVLPDAHYQIRYLEDNIHVINELDPTAFPSEDEPPASET
jgi:hypothetical protein